MGLTFAAGAGISDAATAGNGDGLSNVEAERSQQARGGVQIAEARQLGIHGHFHRAAARLRRLAGAVDVRRARCQLRGARRLLRCLGICRSGCRRYDRHRHREN